MAGIFRTNPASSTPAKRTGGSLFGVNFGQDVSVDSSSCSFETRSPSFSGIANQVSSPRGRSVREIEEQMASLKKENFNLKLRIYFLEELFPPGSSTTTITQQAQENFLKQNIDLKIDMELLRKELGEKQSLLCEAARAMELMENEQKDCQRKSDDVIEELTKKIEQLEKNDAKDGGNSFLGNFREITFSDIDAQQKISELQDRIKEHLTDIEDMNHKNEELMKTLTEKDAKTNDLEERIKQLVYENAELREKLSETANDKLILEYPQLKEELNVSKTQLIEKTNLLAEVEAKFRDKVVAYESACETIQKLLVNMKNLQTEMDKIKEKHSPLRLEKVKQEIIEITPETTEHNDDQLIDVLKIKIAQIIEEKNMNIHKLESELENSASFFENFINQTLWDKNCEIEKLSKILGQSSSSPIKEFILRQSFTEMDYNEIVEYYKHQQRKIDNLFDQLYDTQEGQSMVVIEQLQIELQEARDELNSANVWRAECTEICARLTSRLNELAGFLDSLLKHKDVLGALAADKTRALRKAIDKSLDLSRSWNSMSSTLNNTTSFGDRTLNQLCSLTGMFDRSDANKENEQMFAYDSSNSNQIHVIEKLKSEIKTLKRELGRKRSADSNKKERRSITTYVDNQSESETWSEPDRNVSLARIGLEELNSAQSARRNKTETEMTSSDSASSLNRKSKSRIIEKYSQLEALLTQHENQILQIQCELVEADNRLKTETFKVSELTEELDQYKRVNEMLETEIANLKFMKHDAGYDTDSAIDQLTEERDKLTAKLHLKEMQLEGLREEMKVLKEDNDARIDEIRDEEAQKRRRLEVELESDYREKLKEQERRLHEKLSKDWVTRIMYDQTTHELTQLRHKLYDADLTIEILRENEQDFNEQMMENEKSMRSLKRSLDSAALQASKAVLERTKALSEKFSLEQRVKEITEKMNKVEKDKSDLLNKLEKLNYRTSCLGCNIFKKQSSNGSDISGYTSEDVPGCRSVLPRFDNSSPDLGIESDAGRTSSVENTLLKTTSLLRAVEISKNNTLREVAKGLTKLSHETDALNNNGKEMIHDCEKVEQENDDLKKKLVRTKRALEDTWSKLRTANQRKEQVEKDIRQQILKTQSVLKNVRTNMENEMEQHKVEC